VDHRAPSDRAVSLAGAAGVLDEAGILGEIVHIQREYVRRGDAQRMWDLLLDSVLRTSGSTYGFIGEVEWSDRGIPNLATRAMRWLSPFSRAEDELSLVDCARERGVGPVRSVPAGRQATPHPDVGLLVSQVIATQAPVIVNLAHPPPVDTRWFAPVAGFLGLPLVSAERLVAVVGVTGPAAPYDDRLVALLEPLLASCASIVESLQAARARDRALAELERTAGFLQAVINSTALGVVVVGPDAAIETVNPAAARLLAFPQESLVGLPAADLLAPQAADRGARLTRALLRHDPPGGRVSTTTRAARLDGRVVAVDLSVSPMSIGGERRLVALFQDVTARVEAERAIARAAEILEATPDFVAWADPGGSLQYLNSGGRKMVGLGPDHPVDGLRLDSFCALEDGRLAEALSAVLADGSWTGETVFLGAEGRRVPVSVVLLGDGLGTAEGYLAVLARDLTERHEIEAFKDTFVSNVSHELRTPLASILGYLEMLADGSLGALTDPQASSVEVMGRNGRRLLELIGELLNVAALGREATTRVDRVDLGEVARRAIEAVAGTVETRSLALESCIDPGPIVMGDAGELLTAVANVVGNAVKFTPDGGRVTVRVVAGPATASVVVSDTGIGIPPGEAGHVFDRFFRGTNARREEIQGTGLGLAIVAAVVRRHGGEVELRSEPGCGTTVELRLPAAPVEGDD
jgi:PAS domain S-box-containing protein